MATCVGKPKTVRYVLLLTREEAELLATLTGNVEGQPEAGVRGVSGGIHQALVGAGVPADLMRNRFEALLCDTICFDEDAEPEETTERQAARVRSTYQALAGY